jgi:signal transduction histidine kinase/CheY-like chemotaxis protein
MKKLNHTISVRQNKFDMLFEKVLSLTTQKEYAKALEIATQLIQQKHHHKEDLQSAKLYESIGDIYAQLKEVNPTLEYFYKALKYYADHNEYDLLLNQYAKIGSLQLGNYQFKKAIELFQQGLSLATRLGKNDKLIEFEFMLGNAYNWQDNLEESQKYLLSATNKAADTDNPLLKIRINASYAILLRKMEKYEEAEIYFLKSLKLSEENNSIHYHETRRSYGIMQYFIGNYEKAEELLLEAEKNTTTESSLSVVYEYLAPLYEKLKQFEKAIYYYKKHYDTKFKLLERGYAEDNNITQAKIGLEEARRERLIAEETATAKSLFIATISHEIRTPMNIILGTTSLMQNDDPKPGHIKYLNTLKRSGENLLGIINDILDVSKIEAGKLEIEFEPVLLNEIFESIILSLEQSAKDKKLELHYFIDPKINFAILSDPLRLTQIITNLISNSIKFTATGKINLEAKWKGKNMLQIIVSDTGIGIPKDKLYTIFDQYEQVRTKVQKKYKGTGLGLAISKKLVDLLHGNISIKSKINKGTSFIINLPFEKTEIQQHVTSLSEKKDADFLNGKTILIADDFDDNRFVVRETLMFFNKNVQILEASDGLQAIEVLKNHKADLVIMDLDMPVMNGFEALSEIRKNKKTKQLKVAASTASLITNGDEEFLEFGFDAYLPKPFDIDQFFIMLEKILK